MQQIEISTAELLHQLKLLKSNMIKDQKRALKNLVEDNGIDKGNATEVPNKEVYNQKINDLLKDASYKQMKSNPTTKVEKKVADALKEVESRAGLSSAQQRKFLVNNYSTPPRLFNQLYTGWPNILPTLCNS